ncbi:PREDICTED: heterogeneous nuclear ribonucleoprotein 1-like isoform X2 [Camelina sativa]|uniref:Heterogeneous nuclear ribonucleoprotein 1-like isoform X1 n=1 Tax=Camelina sativa TaxID=90675 RepID=A0ABM1R9S3_CAMSA|nr:PREDICTED: heterogeneous nuclear ribonucleoprotein 1-like isoform X2 [Camelina sativa]XP_019095761.1 PREDICTED: heterogeneous nuclear ribonucleoprotein 1-like isoform X1 [Camelina sativa]XP_019095762.1 PREDICTED: heterogeneous nuclear ribonucleoprotein 1-like isoform X2 [Camelina sativa]
MESDLGKLFVGGISWDTDEERLRDYFSNYGDVVEAVIMRDRATGRARGFGFIVFADPCVAERVIMVDKHIIDGRTVEAKKAVPRDDQQVLKRHASPNHLMLSPVHGGGGGARTKKIFVGGLPSSITEEEFKNYFDQFGTIADVVVMYDHNTQRPRGFGFITFDSDDAVDRVLLKTFHELNGKLVEVKRAVPKEIPPHASSNRSPLPLGVNYGGGVSNRMSANSYFNNFAPGPGFYNNLGGSVGGRFSPVIGSGRNAASAFGLGLNHELSLNLNPSYDGTTSTFGYNRVPSNTYFNGASPNRYTSPIGHNRTDSPYNSNNRDLWGNRTDTARPGWNLNENNRGNWGLPFSSAVANDNNGGYGRNFGTGSGLSSSPFNGFEGSIGELYRGSSVYSDSTWQQQQQQQLPSQSSHELDNLSRSYGYDIDNVGSDPSANDSERYNGSHNVGNRQTNRGIEA